MPQKNNTKNFKNLKLLLLEENNLSFVPNKIKNLSNLRVLNLSRNYIKYFPEISCLKNLEILNLSYNSIQNTTNSFRNLSNLRELNLSNNNICYICSGIENLTKLEILNLSYNHIILIHFIPGKLEKLKELDLSYNIITNINFEEGCLPSLTSLNLKRNGSKHVSNGIKDIFCLKNLSDLKFLNLTGSKIKTKPYELKRFLRLSLSDTKNGRYILYSKDYLGHDHYEQYKFLNDVHENKYKYSSFFYFEIYASKFYALFFFILSNLHDKDKKFFKNYLFDFNLIKLIKKYIYVD